MRISRAHTQYITNKILLDLLNSSFVKIVESMDSLKPLIQEVLDTQVDKEEELDERVREMLDEQEDEMEFMQVDRRTMFFLIKKKLASKYDFLLNKEERFNMISHLILSKLIDADYINFNVSENRVKNLIYNSIDSYIKKYSLAEEAVLQMLQSYKRPLIKGTQEYELIFDELYAKELRRQGLA